MELYNNCTRLNCESKLHFEQDFTDCSYRENDLRIQLANCTSISTLYNNSKSDKFIYLAIGLIVGIAGVFIYQKLQYAKTPALNGPRR